MIMMTQKSGIVYESAENLAAKMRDKSISCVELASAFLEQIDKVNPYIQAIMQVDKARILLDAKQCDVELQQGRVRGLLHGIPISIKDNLLTQEIITTGGSFAFAHNIPSEDATVVKRLRKAGAIILGKTNLPDFALSWETESTVLGRTNNPHNIRYTAGGSSGGEAALLAAGGSALGIGTDSGGSIRLPAHYCGIAGLRTSHGVIPSTGHMPPAEGCPVLGVFANFNAIGPMARSVRDLMYVLPLLTGRDGIDPYADYPPLIKPMTWCLKGLKVAYYTSVQGHCIDPEIEKAVLKKAHFLEKEGAVVTAIEPPGLSDARDLYCRIVGADGGEGIRALLTDLGYERVPQNIHDVLSRMPKNQTVQQVLETRIQWDLFRMNMLKFMQSYDVILCPAAAQTALPHNHSLIDSQQFEKENYLIPYSLMGWPGVVIPAGVSSYGLPIGVQLVGKYRQDYELLLTALCIESEEGSFTCDP